MFKESVAPFLIRMLWTLAETDPASDWQSCEHLVWSSRVDMKVRIYPVSYGPSFTLRSTVRKHFNPAKYSGSVLYSVAFCYTDLTPLKL